MVVIYAFALCRESSRRARGRSLELWARMHRGVLAAVAALGLGAILLARRR